MATNMKPILLSSDPLVVKLIQNETEIHVFHVIVKWIKQMDTKSMFETHLKTDEQKWEKVSQNFILFGFSNNYSADKCQQLFKKWSQFYVKYYDYLSEKLDQKSQEIFDLLKIVHILDFTHFWSPFDLTHIILRHISNKIEIKVYLNDWKRICLDNISAQTKTYALKDTKTSYLNEMSAKLLNERQDIEAFNVMVQMMEPFVSKVQKKNMINWETISQNICEFGYSSDSYSDIKCREKFYYWSEFYAQNYNELEKKLDSDSQKVFDLFKNIQILDFTKLWRSEDSTLTLLKKISENFIFYFNFYPIKKNEEPKETTNEMKKSSLIIQKVIKEKKKSKKQEITEKIKRMGKERQTIPQNENIGNEAVLDFDDMNLCEELLRGIYAYGLVKPSLIQQQTIVPCIGGRDIIAQAQSGMGKTAAFVISALQMIDTSVDKCQALILAPTRELAQQIGQVVSKLGYYMTVNSQVLVGGTSILKDAKLFESNKKPQLVIGTSKRVSDLIKRKELLLDQLKILVLDESDQLLSLSHSETIEILKTLNLKTQLFLSLATITDKMMKRNETLMRSPLKILVKNEELTLEGIKQFYVSVNNEAMKLEVFCDLFKTLSTTQTFVYCNSRERVDQLIDQLTSKKINVTAIHGNMKQSQREDILRKFRCGTYRVLITTDLLGRGIDVQQVFYIVNYDLPIGLENYIHRIGRGGRFGRKGIAISLVTTNEMETIRKLEKLYNTRIEEMPTSLELI